MNFTLTGTILGHDHRPVVGQTFVVFPSSGHTPSEHGVHLPPARLITDMAGRLRRLGALPGEDGVDIPMVEGQRFTLQATNGSYRSVSFYPAPGEVLDVREITPVSTTNPSASLVRGASAYEVAVANGFVGTPTQWVSSLTIEGMEPPPVVTDHQALVNRDADDAHPISSITDLAPALSSIVQALDAKVDHGYTGYVTDDDDRLEDAREPLPHPHSRDDVEGLESALDEIRARLDALEAE